MIYVSFHFGIKNENEKKKKQNICIINPQKILRVNKNKNYRKKIKENGIVKVALGS